jgi:riboflavin synthase
MFTGIVEELGSVQKIASTKTGIRLSVRARTCARGVKLGDSIAVNGCCLTVVKITRSRGGVALQFDLLKETWNRTNLRSLKPGAGVNLERSLAANGRLGGHFVSGHVDGLGKIVRWERSGADHLLDIEAPAEVSRYLVFKGSVAVDGISLTVAAVRKAKKQFRIWIIPHTFEVTALKERKVGDYVNLEADLLGKYVASFLGKIGR